MWSGSFNVTSSLKLNLVNGSSNGSVCISVYTYKGTYLLTRLSSYRSFLFLIIQTLRGRGLVAKCVHHCRNLLTLARLPPWLPLKSLAGRLIKNNQTVAHAR